MVVYIKQLTGQRLKKALMIPSAGKQYHNKNKSGGNFSFNLRPTTESFGEKGWVIFGIQGYHNTEGVIYNLNWWVNSRPTGVHLINKENYKEINFEELAFEIRRRMNRHMYG